MSSSTNPNAANYRAPGSGYGTNPAGNPLYQNPPPVVLGVSTASGSSGSSGGGGQSREDIFRSMYGSAETMPPGWLPPGSEQAEAARREAEARGAIESGYSGYFSELDSILNEGLPGQRTAQENIASSQFNQGVNTLSGQRDSSLQDLTRESEKTESRQSRTLKDISDNLRNSFTAGNVYLGARGAGDSSAANQYAYALTKLGSRQRGDVLSQYGDIQADIGLREQKVKDIFNTETRNLEFEKDQKINGIAQWFSEQQNALKQAKATGQLSKGQDLAALSQNLLNVALQQLNNIKAEATNRRSALEEWAMNNSTNVRQLASNIGQISGAPFAQGPNAQPIVGTPQMGAGGGFNVPIGFGGNTNEKDRFGNSIR